MSLSRKHRNRLLSAAGLIALVAVCLVVGGWAALALALAAAAVGQWEFYAMHRVHMVGRVSGLLLGAVALLLTHAVSPAWGLGVPLAAFWATAIAFTLRMGDPAARASARPPQLASALLTPAGVLYIPCSLMWLVVLPPAEVGLLLAITVAADSGAYYAGSSIGGPKLWPSLSPKKTWAGSLGGMAASALTALALGLAFSEAFPGFAGASWKWWLCLGVVVNLAAQLGDFVESAMKRAQGVKDSGSLIPGHGGLLDRIDALLLAAPVYMACRLFFVYMTTPTRLGL